MSETTALDAMAESLAAIKQLFEDPARRELPPCRPGDRLGEIAEVFGLTAFERDCLLLCAARELVPGIDVHCARQNGSDDRPWPTFGTALAVLPAPSWSALLPDGALRANHLLRLGPGEVLLERPLFLEERVLHALLDSNYVDDRVARRLKWIEPPLALTATHRAVADSLARRYGATRQHLWTSTLGEGIPVVAAAMAERGLALGLINATGLPALPDELDLLARICRREATLGSFGLLVDLDQTTDPAILSSVNSFVAALGPLAITCGLDPRAGESIERLRLDRPPFAERVEQWRTALASGTSVPGAAEPVELENIVARFDLDSAELDAAIDEMSRRQGEDPNLDAHDALWQSARVQAHARLEDLAQRLAVQRCWSDLVVPQAIEAALRALLAHARQKATVDHAWGFAIGERGGGSSALFAGPSGTGKTLAAEVLATELGLDLYRIDLSAVVSKFIGETEKNLRRVFDAAEAGGAVLLFDEADALFGKRTEVKDSHDRHANIEVSYLLQRMETFGGLALLTTNYRKHLDEAFLRRIPFLIEFPFPDEGGRRALWTKAFPVEAPVEGLDINRLAQLSVTGGNIRTIARTAASIAADSGKPVTMAAIKQAVLLEYGKLGRPITPSELVGWPT